jgi:murein DD-endopeptidase MepM/ murein hydrolase activator NlpD
MTPPTTTRLHQRLVAYGTLLDTASPQARTAEPARPRASRRLATMAITTAVSFAAVALTQILPGRSVPTDSASPRGADDQRMVFPVAGQSSFVDTFGAPRRTDSGAAFSQEGVDVFASVGTPVRAVRNGTVSEVGVATQGGHHLIIVDNDGNRYFYGFLQGPPDLPKGRAVKTGQVIGQIGSPVGRGAAPSHLHLEIRLEFGLAVNPYPILQAIKTGAVADTAKPPPTLVVELRNRAVNAREIDARQKGVITRLEGEVLGRSKNTNVADMRDFLSGSAPIQALGPPEGAPEFEARSYVWTTSNVALRQRHCGTSIYATFLLPVAECALPVPIPVPKASPLQGNVISFTDTGKPITKASPIYRWLTTKVGSTTRAAKANLIPGDPKRASDWYWFGNSAFEERSKFVPLPAS